MRLKTKQIYVFDKCAAIKKTMYFCVSQRGHCFVSNEMIIKNLAPETKVHGGAVTVVVCQSGQSDWVHSQPAALSNVKE